MSQLPLPGAERSNEIRQQDVLRIVRDGSPAGYLPTLWWRAGSKTQEVAGQVGRQSGFNKACTQARWLPHERLT